MNMFLRGQKMNLPENPQMQLDLQTSSVGQRNSKAKRRSANGIFRFVAPVVIAGIVLCAPIEPGVLAKTGHQADSKPDSAIDPDAMDALDKMDACLRTLKTFQVRADVATDKVLDDGRPSNSALKSIS
jgi:hypothetical protein